jgi:enamine deaminase RidA (YjgF/YER057c/UK114 family)
MGITRHGIGSFASEAVVRDNTVYLVEVSRSGAMTVRDQTREVLDKIDAVLAKVGSDKSKLLTAQVFLADISTWAEMNEVWEAWIDPANPPIRATVEAKLARPGYLVEIVASAAI